MSEYHPPSPHHSSPEVEALLKSLYEPDGYYDSISKLFEEHGVKTRRSRIIHDGIDNPQITIFGQQVGDNGLISITGSDTTNSIVEGRWDYRILLPSESEQLTKMHISEINGGKFKNRPPLYNRPAARTRWFIGTLPAFHTDLDMETKRYSRAYLNIAERALKEMIQVLDR